MLERVSKSMWKECEEMHVWVCAQLSTGGYLGPAFRFLEADTWVRGLFAIRSMGLGISFCSRNV